MTVNIDLVAVVAFCGAFVIWKALIWGTILITVKGALKSGKPA